ncbi:hypothetical protein ACQCVB_19460 [Fictibacillus phosphorivorans]|uniref:hypothetical protein n=1 Tax=Fictibacillus phosphorivorans TaxID=1221500 RepID=UPI003CF90235
MLLKKIMFILSTSFIVLVFLSSVIYYFTTGDVIPEVNLKFENNQVINPPYSPIEHFPLGTNNKSNDIFYIILSGAKYTIGLAILIATLRLVTCLVLGAIAGTYFYKGLIYIKGLIDGWHYFPTTLAVYLILHWILIQDALIDGKFTLTFTERIIIQVFVMVCIGIPPLFYLLAREFSYIRELNFIEGVKVLGGNKTYILFKHAPKFIIPKLRVIFIQEIIHVLLLLVHLGVMGMLLGGSVLTKDLFENEVFVTLTNEWSGLIGLWSRYIFTTYAWMPFIPIIFLTITILCLQYMVNYLKDQDILPPTKQNYPQGKKLKLPKNISNHPAQSFVYLQKKGG